MIKPDSISSLSKRYAIGMKSQRRLAMAASVRSADGHHVPGSGYISQARVAGSGSVAKEASCSIRRKEKVVRAGGLEPPQANAPRIFIPATAFAAARKRLESGLSLRHASLLRGLGAARLVSTPSRKRAWLGIAILQGSPNLSSSTSRISPRALNRLSPVRLPISPRPHTAVGYSLVTTHRQGCCGVYPQAHAPGFGAGRRGLRTFTASASIMSLIWAA